MYLGDNRTRLERFLGRVERLIDWLALGWKPQPRLYAIESPYGTVYNVTDKSLLFHHAMAQNDPHCKSWIVRPMTDEEMREWAN